MNAYTTKHNALTIAAIRDTNMSLNPLNAYDPETNNMLKKAVVSSSTPMPAVTGWISMIVAIPNTSVKTRGKIERHRMKRFAHKVWQGCLSSKRLGSQQQHENSEAFVQSEINRVDKTLIGFKRTVFKIIPLIIIVCSTVIIMLDKPIYRATVISVIAMMIIIILIDSNAIARLENYKKLLISEEVTAPNN